MNQAVIPEARLHIGNKLGRAIDLMMTKKALYSFFEERSSFNYFVQSVLRPESENDTDMKSFCAVIEDMDERGLFTRVMLRELLELGYKRAGTTESGDTVFEVGKFINFLDVIVHKSPGEDVPLTFIDKNIRMSIILVARQDTNTLGPDRFVRRIQSQIERYSSEVIYIFAMGQRDIALAKQVMEICETLPNIQRLHAGDFMFRGTNRDIPCFCGIFHSSKVVG